MTLTPKQTFEIGRVADRCGPVAVRPHDSGAVLVLYATAPARPRPDYAIAIDHDGRVVARRRLRIDP